MAIYSSNHAHWEGAEDFPCYPSSIRDADGAHYQSPIQYANTETGVVIEAVLDDLGRPTYGPGEILKRVVVHKPPLTICKFDGSPLEDEADEPVTAQSSKSSSP